MGIHDTPTSSTAVTSFQFDGCDVRVVMRANEPWFVAGDLSLELAYRDAADLTRLLDEDEKGTHIVDTLGGAQNVSIISEPGLYRAILRRRASRKLAEHKKERIARFQRWVFHDVIPAIRKTGSYGVTPAVEYTVPRSLSEALRLAADQSEQIERLEAERQQNAPKIESFDHFVASRSEGIGLRKGMVIVGVFADKAIKHLRDRKVLYGQPATPYKYYRDQGYFTMDPVRDRHDHMKVRPQTHITPRGLEWLRRTLPEHLFLQQRTRQLALLPDVNDGSSLPH